MKRLGNRVPAARKVIRQKFNRGRSDATRTCLGPLFFEAAAAGDARRTPESLLVSPDAFPSRRMSLGARNDRLGVWRGVGAVGNLDEDARRRYSFSILLFRCSDAPSVLWFL